MASRIPGEQCGGCGSQELVGVACGLLLRLSVDCMFVCLTQFHVCVRPHFNKFNRLDNYDDVTVRRARAPRRDAHRPGEGSELMIQIEFSTTCQVTCLTS